MSAHVLLNLLNELRKAIKCEARRVFYCFFATIKQFNNKRGRILGSIYHMILEILKHCVAGLTACLACQLREFEYFKDYYEQ